MATTTSSGYRAAVHSQIPTVGDALAAEPLDGSVEAAQATRGLIEAYRATGDDSYLPAAAVAFVLLDDDFDSDTGALASEETLSTDEVGTILGAINSKAPLRQRRHRSRPSRGDPRRLLRAGSQRGWAPAVRAGRGRGQGQGSLRAGGADDLLILGPGLRALRSTPSTKARKEPVSPKV